MEENSDRIHERKSSSVPHIQSPRKISGSKGWTGSSPRTLVRSLTSSFSTPSSPRSSPQVSPSSTPPESPRSTSPFRGSRARSNSMMPVTPKRTRAEIYEEVVNTNHCMQSITVRLHDMEKLTTRLVTEKDTRTKARQLAAADAILRERSNEGEEEGVESSIVCIQYYNKECIIL